VTSKTIAPYGTWTSPVTTELMTGAAIGLSSIAVDGGALYWLESRPSESGRAALVRRTEDGAVADITPQPISVGSRVHEYGGGAYAVENGIIIYSERKDGSIWLMEGRSTRKIATPEGCRYADFEFDFPRRRVLAIREDYRDRPPTDPKATIVALPLGDGSEQILFEGPDFLSSPRLSPDGKTLAFISWMHPDMPWDATLLHVAAIADDGSLGPSFIVGDEQRESIVQPRWSPAGVLHFSSDRSSWWNLYALQGTTITPILPVKAEIGGPHWVFGQRSYGFLPDQRIIVAIVEQGIRRAAIIADGKLTPLDLGQVHEAPVPLGEGLAYIATPPTEPPTITIKPALSSGGVKPIRAGAPSVLPNEAISIGEPIDFPTRGVTGHAFWYVPKSADHAAPEGELPPLVVLSHGGPTSMVTNGFGLNVQWWTSRGFGVVDVNYGGSTGYGRPYRQMLDGQWGIVDVEDSIAAARFLIERGLVDANRIVIRGGSAGGFTTLASLTSSDVFKAGASLYGVADLKLLASDTHKFESRYLDRLIGPLPDATKLYDERSPIHHLDKLACPIIFFQGLEDKTVPPNQAETMVAAMDARRLPVSYYAFEGEGHGFRKAETLRRVLELELGFYGRVFGFTPPGLSECVIIKNLG
jgi:dipeptidyl aminopeptidase/acylaminoacyl peptidase